MKNQKEIKKITDQIAKKYKPEKIILFGSYAWGKPTEDSDVDLFIVKKTNKRFGSRLFDVAKIIDSEMGTDALVYTPKEWKDGLKKNITFLKR